jgi:AcrR family transcriptional regulator
VNNRYSGAVATSTVTVTADVTDVSDTAADADVSREVSVRERLVAAAAEVFAERGYEGARVQEIVRRAGLSTGAIYTNFRNKADLLLAAVGTAPVDSLFDTIELAGGTAEGLRRAGHELPTARRGERTLLFEALVAARRDPEVATLLRKRLMTFRSLMAHVVGNGQREGSLAADVDVDALAEFCQALGMGFLLMEAVGLPHAGDAEWRALIDRLLGAISPAGTSTPSSDTDTPDTSDLSDTPRTSDTPDTSGQHDRRD